MGPPQPAAACLVVSRVVIYHNVCVDLSRSRAVHVLEHEPCCPDPVLLSSDKCRAIHHGFCSPLLKLPAFSVGPLPSQSSPPVSLKSPVFISNNRPTVNISKPLTSSSPIVPNSTIPNNHTSNNSKPASPILSNSPVLKMSLPLFNPIDLLAEDLEDQLNALVNAFVAQDKVRTSGVAGKENGGKQHETTPPKLNGTSSPSSPIIQQSPPPVSPTMMIHSNSIISTPTLKEKTPKPKAVIEVCKPNPPTLTAEINDFTDSLNSMFPGYPPPPREMAPFIKAQVALHEDLRRKSNNVVSSSAPEKLLTLSPPPLQRSETDVPPHPKLTSVQKQHIKERSMSPLDRSLSPVKMLTRGSVAERVLLFECCPEKALERTTVSGTKSPAGWKQPSASVSSQEKIIQATNLKNKELPTKPPVLVLPRPPVSSTQPQKSARIPRFYFPHGRPKASNEVEALLQNVTAAFATLSEGQATQEQFPLIVQACHLPLYWKGPLFSALGGVKRGYVCCDTFLEYWRRVTSTCHDNASQFIRILTRGPRTYLIPDDFIPLIQDIVDTHPGLAFLMDATEFHSRYVNTVIARIYFCINKSWTGRITIPELRRSNFLKVLEVLEIEEDINLVTEYFSYEHFYVIYCKFWELDQDHDLYIDKTDLCRHNDGAMSRRMVERIFSGAVTRGTSQKEGKMSYVEFVWFLIAEEDKRHPRSIEYWFRCMDLDGDGYLSMYELQYFYEEQIQRMESLGIETLPFKDCLCQMLDMIQTTAPGKVSLADLKKSRMTPIFFDTFFNLEKFLDHEQRDPFSSQRDQGEDLSDWERYAADEYELLVAEEGGPMCHHEGIMYEDYENDIDELSPNLDSLHISAGPPELVLEEDEYDYTESDGEYPF